MSDVVKDTSSDAVVSNEVDLFHRNISCLTGKESLNDLDS